jgi:hypothetical protein
MASTRSKSASRVPDFDPYGYSPYDPQAQYQGYGPTYSSSPARDRGYGSADESPRRHRSSRRSRHEEDHKRDGSRRQSSRRADRTRSRARENDDAEWDTDYDPHDKYYLSGDDDDIDRSSSRKYKPDNYRPKADRRRSTHHGSDRHQASRRPPMARGDSDASNASARRGSRGSRPRPSPRQHSSYNGRPRNASRRHPPNASRSARLQSMAHGDEHDPWGQAVRSALKAGTIAALKMSAEKGSIYDKVPRVATAAVGAAVVDAFLTSRHPDQKGGKRHAAMRNVTELVIGNLVAKPAVKTGHKKGIF